MENLQEKYSADMTLLAINLQEDRELVRFVRAESIGPEPGPAGRDGAVGSAYKASAIPMQVLIDREGSCGQSTSRRVRSRPRARREIEKLNRFAKLTGGADDFCRPPLRSDFGADN